MDSWEGRGELSLRMTPSEIEYREPLQYMMAFRIYLPSCVLYYEATERLGYPKHGDRRDTTRRHS
jgi:hypothetical protein